MSKKKWLLAIPLIVFGAWLVYRLSWIPRYTDAVNGGVTYLVNGWNCNPLGMAAAVAGPVTATVTLAKLAWNRTKTGLQGTYSTLIGEKDRQLNGLSNSYQSLATQTQEMQGKLTATQSELETVKTTLSGTQQKLADATTQLQRKMDEYNNITRIKAEALKHPDGNPTRH